MTETPTPLEVELKLAVPPAQVPDFLRLMARRRGVPRKQELHTRYFDTPDFALGRQGFALRVRRAGRRWLQTLKTEGERSGGLSIRHEFETPTRGGMIDWARFPAEAQDAVPEALRSGLGVAFETRFVRTAWEIVTRGGACIEVALDVGEILADGRTQPVCEIELELKSGSAEALFDLARRWAGQLDLLPFDVSKAERGMRLARHQRSGPIKAAPVALSRGMTVEDGFAAICQACLAQFQANLHGILTLPPADAVVEPGEGASVTPTPGGASPPPQASSIGVGSTLSPSPASGRGLAGEGANVVPKPTAVPPLPNPPPQAGEGANAMPTPSDDDIEYVHQARVALRRLRAGLRIYRRACTLPEELLGGLRALAAALGPPRDWDVLCSETLAGIGERYDDPAAWRSWMDTLLERRAAVRATMREALVAGRPGEWLLAFQQWLMQRGWRAATPPARLGQMAPQRDAARRTLRKGHRRIVARAREFERLSALERHVLRIAFKRQRYAVEFFRDLFGSERQARYLQLARDIQDSLGRANDAHIAETLLAESGLDGGRPGGFARGWLAAQVAAGSGSESAALLEAFTSERPCW
jgi:inorganic triphosphatase YgiF